MASNSNENTHTGVNLEGKLRFKLFKLRYLKNVDGHSSTDSTEVQRRGVEKGGL